MSKDLLIEHIDEVGYQDVTESLRLIRTDISREIKDISETCRFNRVYRYSNFISDEMCLWIINEAEKFASENGGWTKKRHKNYPTTDLPVKEIPALWSPLMNLTVRDIFPLIASHYGLNPYFLGIGDLFVIKYDVAGQDHLGFHKDGSLISFNILLNDNFDGGGTTINHPEGAVNHQSQKRDLFMHSGKLLHAGNKITRGQRYIIVGFIEYIPGFNKMEPGSETKINTFNISLDEIGRET